MEVNDLYKIFSNIPEDVILYKILPYAYNIQPKSLCEDIQSFHMSYNYLNNYYIGRYRFLGNNYLWQQWLAHDIATFMNNFTTSQYGYTDFCLKKI